MEIGEAIAVLIEVDGADACPFCDSAASPKFESHTLLNDSAELARNAGGMPRCAIRNPEADAEYEIWESYWDTEDGSRVCMNAHHILPGNAAFGECPKILMWLAGSVTVRKQFYDQKIEVQVRQVSCGRRDKKRSDLAAAKYPGRTLCGDPTMVVTYSTSKGRSAIRREKTVSENMVTGTVPLDVNDGRNNAWLPSNNAVGNWGEMVGVMSSTRRSFHQAYASRAMVQAGRQFHDAHPTYSTEIVKKMNEIADELQKLADKCLAHQQTKCKSPDGPYPAPARLEGCLFRLAKLVGDELDLRKTKPKTPWYTSDLAIQVGRKIR